MKRQKAFTLLELLVVITIIGILSSIVIVSMSGSTDSATIAKGKAYAQQVHALLGANAAGVWNFDEGAGATAKDMSGYGNDGSLIKGANGTGLDWVASDIEGTVLQFDGADDYVAFSNVTMDLDAGYCISFWAKANSFPGTTYVGLVGNISDSYAKAIYFGANGSSIVGETNTNSENFVHSGSFGAFQTGEWYHIMATGEAGSYRTYINGIEFYEYTNASKNDLTINSIGKMGTRDSFNGFIDEVRIYSSALSAAEIQKHYVQGLKNLLFNQAITQTEYDQRMEELNKTLASNEL